MIDHKKDNEDALTAAAEARREFLRKSVYAAYAAPVLMSLLVEKANAAGSWNPGNIPPPGQGGYPPPPPYTPKG